MRTPCWPGPRPAISSQQGATTPRNLPQFQSGSSVSNGGRMWSLDVPGNRGSRPHCSLASDLVTRILRGRHFLPGCLGSSHCHGDQLRSWEGLSPPATLTQPAGGRGDQVGTSARAHPSITCHPLIHPHTHITPCRAQTLSRSQPQFLP